MENQTNSALRTTLKVMWIIFLAFGATQGLIGVCWLISSFQWPGFLGSNSGLIATLAVPLAVLSIYIIVRLYTETKSPWRTVLAVIGYLGIIGIWLIAMFTNSWISPVIGIGFLILSVLLSPVLCLTGLYRETPWMTLVSLMLCGILDCVYTFSMMRAENAFIVTLFCLIPLLLLATADWTLFNKVRSKKSV